MNPAQLATLKIEVQSDPAGRGYAGMTDAQAEAAINTPVIPGPVVAVAISDIVAYLRWQQSWLPIKASTNPAAQAAVDLNSDLRQTAIDVTAPLVQGMLGALVTASLLTQAQSDAITAMGRPLITCAQAIGWTVPPSAVDINAARAA